MTALASYEDFLATKRQLDGDFGFDPEFLPDALFPFQRALVQWAVRKGRAAIFADCGLGKTLMELTWAENVAQRTGQPVLLLTPLAVAPQVVEEADKFGIEAARSLRGERPARVVVTNYERLHLFDPEDFGGVVCDESSILKSFDGVTKARVTEFMRTRPYRLLATATAAPNDFTELGTSSEALGGLGYMDMFARFFTNSAKNGPHGYRGVGRSQRLQEVRFKGHAEKPFWRWVASWARALRRPSDLGFDDSGFVLPEPLYREHVVKARTVRPGLLFDLPAIGLREEREERRRTIAERCEMVAELVADTGRPAVAWCHLNDEGDHIASLIPGAEQVSGKDSDEAKEEKFLAFSHGQIRVLVTKPTIGAWGLNWQHCDHLTFFPSHSYEQYYQAVRRCWRFGQKNRVTVDIVATEGEIEAQKNLKRKADQADRMFSSLVEHMRDEQRLARSVEYDVEVRLPSWLES